MIKASFLFFSFLAAPALAATTTCIDPTGQFLYEAYRQEGGPCCGRSTTILTAFGKIVKQTHIEESVGGMPAVHDDSNPHLKMNELRIFDMKNSSVSGNFKTNRYAENMKFSRDDGTQLFPGVSEPVLTVSLICSQSHSIVPAP